MHDRTCPECGAVFSPRYGSQVCCSDECQKIRDRRLSMENQKKRREREQRQAILERRDMKRRLARRDLEHKTLGVPVKVTVDHRGIRREIRGHCAGGGLPAFGSLRDSRVLNLGF